MKKYVFITILAITYIKYSYSQSILIKDKTTLLNIENVCVENINKTKKICSDRNGIIQLNDFTETDTLIVSAIGYQNITLTKANSKRVLYLSEKAMDLNMVVISANRSTERLADVPQQISLLTKKELEFNNTSTLADAIGNTGNVLIQKSQLGGGSPILRGFEANKVLLVIDGVRLNNAIYRGGHLQNIITMDNNSLEKAEILFGPASVIYGSDALGGVIHFTTKNPMLADSSTFKVKTHAFNRYGSAAGEKTSHVDFSLANKKLGSFTSVTYSNFGDLRQGNNRNPLYGNWGKRTWYVGRINNTDTVLINNSYNIQKPSGYTQYDLVQKFLFAPNQRTKHILNLQYSTSSNIPRYDRLTQTSGKNPRFAEWYYGPQKRLMTAYSLNHQSNTTLFDEMKLILAYQQIEESRHDRTYKGKWLNHRIENLDIFTLNTDFFKRINKHELRYGLDAWYNDVKSTAYAENVTTGETKPLDTRYPDGKNFMQSAAAYLSHTYELNKKLILTEGIRINYVRLYSRFDDKTFFPFPFNEVTQTNFANSGSVGLIYNPGFDWRFTLTGSTGFRAPNLDDMSKVFESVPGRVIVPNPYLKPEYTYNLDLGISKTFNDKITVGNTAYYTLYNNAITTAKSTFNGSDSIVYGGVTSMVTTMVNANRAYIFGNSAYLMGNVTENFSIHQTYNFTFGRIKTDSVPYPLDHIPPVFGKTSFRLQLKKFMGEFYIIYNGAKLSKDYNLLGEDNHRFSADPVKGYTPAWHTLNIRTAYQINTFIQIQFACENLTDLNYRPFASNISGPGRNFIVTLRGRF